MNLGPAEIGLIVLAVMLLFGYKKLPDASRSLGRSLRIFKSEVEDLPGPGARRGKAGPQVRTLTARATMRPRISSDATAWTDMMIFAQCASGMTSVGLNAVELVRPR